jgi:hypothetical protein
MTISQHKQIHTLAELDAMTPREVKSYETRLRRAAARQGLRLEKSRQRDPNGLLYGTYQLVDSSSSFVVYADRALHGYGLDLSDIAGYLFNRDGDS